MHKRLAELRQSVYGVILLRLALLLVIYSASRLAFFLYNRSYFGQLSGSDLTRIAAGGLRFDLSAIVYVNFLYLLVNLVPLRARARRRYQLGADALFVATNALALALNAVDFEYYRFTLKRMTSAVFAEFEHEKAFGSLLAQLVVEHWPATLALMVGVALVVFATRLTRLDPRPLTLPPRRYYLQCSAAFPAVLALMIVCCRGGFFGVSHRPITNANAAAYVRAPELTALVLNTPFSLIRTIDKEPLERRQDFASEEELAQVFTPVHHAEPRPGARQVNVVLIILESFGANAIGHLNRHLENGTYHGYTPFLDELSQRCRTFPNAFANGLHSIEALPSLVAAIPSLKQQFIVSPYANNRLVGLPALLGQMGYHTALFHGAPNGSMGFDAFGRQAGFDAYYGMTEYGNDADFDGAWGIWDEEFLQYFARTLGTLQKPFFGAVFTLTSHSPFRVPERYAGRFPQGTSRAHQVMGYTDYALRRFFDTAATMPWYEDTLFIVTADHGAARTHEEYKIGAGRFRVPLLMCNPGDPGMRGWDEQPVQHVDLMPSVLGYVGFRGDYLAFGTDIFAERAPRRAFHYHPDGTYELIEGEEALLFDGEKSFGLYDYTQDRTFKTNLLDEQRDRAAAMERTARAIIQQYNNRMREDRLVEKEFRLTHAR